MADPNKRPWENKLSDAAAKIESELRAMVKTIDDDVVPEVRRHGSAALRSLAARMQTLAESMDDARRREEAAREPTVKSGEPPHPQN